MVSGPQAVANSEEWSSHDDEIERPLGLRRAGPGLLADELDAVRDAIERHGAPEVVGFHKLRARRAGSRRYVDLHVQFRDGTTLRRAHEISHELQGAIRERLRGADVLIHLEPQEAADPSEHVHRSRRTDGEQHARVPDVPVDEQQEGGDQADRHRHEP